MSRISKVIAILAGLALALGLRVDSAEARPRPHRGKRFESNKTFGLGVMIGAPIALSGKYFYQAGGDKAFDFGIGGSGYHGDRSGLHLHADHLWHLVSLTSVPAFELPLYVGVGARLFTFDYDRNDMRHDGAAFGIRVPIGIAFDFNQIPIDIFIEIAPVFDIFFGDYHDDFGGDFQASVGMRYYFL